jgi:predicted nucleotide-binding protein (sugar kinase/HSP70/actin superfamily)
VLDRLGLAQVPIFSLNQSSEAFGQLPGLRLGVQIYSALVAVNELERLAREIRPFEVSPGSADKAYAQSLAEVCGALEAGRSPARALRAAAERFIAVETDDCPRPRILVVGETYVRMQPFANCDVVRKIEALGGEAIVPTFLEWVHHVTRCMRIFTRESRQTLKRLATGASEWLMRRIERRLGRALATAFREKEPPSVETLWENARRAGFVPFFGDASLGLGLAIEMAERGIDGVVNVMPFTCIPGSVARSQLARAARFLGGVPVLDVEFDGRGGDLLRDELEMFMDQARERHRARFRRCASRSPVA